MSSTQSPKSSWLHIAEIAIGALIGGLLAAVALYFGGSAHFGGTPLNYDKTYQGADFVLTGSQGGGVNNFKTAAYPGGTETTRINSNGSTTISSLAIGGGTVINNYSCASVTWNPGSVATATPSAAETSTDIALTGAVLGDTCTGSLSSATTTGAQIGCAITGTATATVSVFNISGSALDLATGTAKACFTH